MKIVRSLFGLAILAASLAPAIGQSGGGSTQWRTKPVERFIYASKDAERALQVYATCISNRRQVLARILVLAKPGSVESDRAARQIVKTRDDQCLHGFDNEVRLNMSRPAMTGAIGQALVLREYPGLPATLAARTVDPAQEAAHVAELDAGEIFARCVVRQNPAAALALIGTLPRSSEEQAAIRPLMPAMSDCLKAGSTIELQPANLRNVIGIASYRLGAEHAASSLVPSG